MRAVQSSRKPTTAYAAFYSRPPMLLRPFRTPPASPNCPPERPIRTNSRTTPTPGARAPLGATLRTCNSAIVRIRPLFIEAPS